MSPKPIRSKDARTLRIEIDHREALFPEGASVLRAAELNKVYVPSLCSHKDLSPFGGCRLCMVEIEGMRGYPLACSTIAQEGMKILTDTATLREMRREILQLILSEHPSSCLMCTEKDECRENQYTIRKAGVSTGCRYCPNNTQCELQDVVESLGLTEITYPVYYRGYEAEHDDPFFDRDYNICILCGRCVRMCQEVRGTAVLAFQYRGPKTQISPAFGKNHVEAGCEFCGACVSVCPTGALADKSSKWDGKPDGFKVSTCPFCGIGCQIELYHKNGRLSQVRPNLDPEVSDGQLCVRGRFSLPEATHHHERAKKPMLRRGEYFREVTWAETLDEVAGKLRGVAPDDFLMLVSGDLTNESLYAAQKFVRACLKCDSIDSTVRSALAGGPGLWSALFSLPISMKGIADADSILAAGFDSRFCFSVAGVQIRRALKEGAALVTIDSRDSNLARYTEHWLRPLPGTEGVLLRALAESLADGKATRELKAAAKETGVGEGVVERAAKVLASGRDLAVVIGPRVFECAESEGLLQALLKLAGRGHTTFLPLYHGSNSRGALELGVLGELLPGLARAVGKGLSLADVREGRAKPRVIYLVGEVPFFERPPCEYLIAQDIYLPPFKVDAFLPAASFAEAGGTLTNIEGRVQELVKIEDLPDGAVGGFARPDWFIFSELAGKLDCPGLGFQDSAAILREIHEAVPGFPARPDRKPRRLAPLKGFPVGPSPPVAAGRGEYVLIGEPASFRHRGIDLCSVVEGLSELSLEEDFRMNPEDMAQLGIAAGEPVTIMRGGAEVTAPAKADEECPRGAVYFFRPDAYGGLVHRRLLEPLYRLGAGAVRVKIRAASS